MENELQLQQWKNYGANPTPMAFTELFTALQQRTVDGQDNGAELLNVLQRNFFILGNAPPLIIHCLVRNTQYDFLLFGRQTVKFFLTHQNQIRGINMLCIYKAKAKFPSEADAKAETETPELPAEPEPAEQTDAE